MSEYITTYTGKHFNPTQPNPDLISIQDIAHALSLICRGNGHVQTFWSVGQHCICCAKEAAARGLSDRMVLACLLHDASECYMSDVPTPFKKELPEYQEQLNEIDHAMLLYDLENLLGEVQYGEIPDLQIDLDYTVRSFAEVEDEYLMLFAKYSGTVAPKTVYLEDIADAFEECMDGWVQFLDTRTGEIVALSEDPYMACEEDQELWESARFIMTTEIELISIQQKNGVGTIMCHIEEKKIRGCFEMGLIVQTIRRNQTLSQGSL